MIQETRHITLRTLLVGALLCIALAALWTILPSHSAHAATSLPRADAGHATIIVLDMSGSMAQNDPNGLRCSAADAYIDLSGFNDYIGVVGLDNNNGLTTGSHNFQTAQAWAQPTTTATFQDRQGLKTIITTASSGCKPDLDTPTYDALTQAYTMLNAVTKQHPVSGSVILLTDGVPCPNTQQQIDAIKSDLVPQFQGRQWPIDTIGLGVDTPGTGCNGTFHSFLQGVSDATGGSFYDDSHGPVPDVSPLNIAPFFAQIFAKYSHRTIREDVPPTTLNGGASQRNFTVIDGTQSLDVLLVKDQPGTLVSLLDPNSQAVPALSKGAYNVIYSINQPQSGQWIVNAIGSGQFLMYDLQETDVGLSTPTVNLQNLTVPAHGALPLGQPLVITTSLTVNGQLITDNSYSVYGTIAYGKSAGTSCPSTENCRAFKLSDSATPGIYAGNVTIPETAPAGSYIITVGASTISLTNIAASSATGVRLEVFPIPSFLSPQTSQPTDTAINSTVIQWWGPLRVLYSLPVISRLSSWPLQGHPTQPYTVLQGEVQWKGQPYPGATITANACRGQLNAPALVQNGQGTFCPDHSLAIPVAITQDGQGNFAAQFEPPASGFYTIVFQTGGSFNDSHGDFGAISRLVDITIQQPSTSQLEVAGGITLFYIVVLLFLIYLLRFWLITPRPFGEWLYNPGRESSSGRRFDRAHRGPIAWFFFRNRITSRQAGMPSGLVFLFRHGNRIEVKSDGSRNGRDWQFSSGQRVRSNFQRVSELSFHPANQDRLDDESASDSSRYMIYTSTSDRDRMGGRSGGGTFNNGRGSKRPAPTSGPRATRSSRPKSGSTKSGKQPSWRDYYYEE